MNEELVESSNEEVINEVSVNEEREEFYENESTSRNYLAVAIGAGVAVLGGLLCKKYVMPGIIKIKDKFSKHKSETVAETDDYGVEIENNKQSD